MTTDPTPRLAGEDLTLQLARENIAAGVLDINDSYVLLARHDALRAALVALADKSPLYARSGAIAWLCWYCGGEDILPFTEQGHDADCAWLVARRLLAGKRLLRR